MSDFQRKNMLKSELVLTNKSSIRKVNILEFLTNNLIKNKYIHKETYQEEETK